MKETLVLLHGALGSKNQFLSLMPELKQHFDVHAINFAGHGGREVVPEFSMQLFTKNLIDYLEANALENVVIFGYSMGGYVGLTAALSVPTKIKKVITLGTKFNWEIASAEKEVKLLNPTKIEEKVPLFAEKLRQEHTPQDWKKVMRNTAQMMMNMVNGAKLSDGDFKNIDQQVVIGIGSLDQMVSYEESASVSGLIPNSKLEVLDGVKHPIDTIAAEELVRFIVSN